MSLRNWLRPWRRPDDGLAAIKAMRLSSADGGSLPAGARRRILFNSQFSWPYGPVEYALAAALRARGHEVLMTACGRLPGYCEQETALLRRPACEDCLARLLARFDAYGLPYRVLSELLGGEEAAEVQAEAARGELGALRELRELGVPVGRLAFLNLFHYFKGYPLDVTGPTEEAFRRCLASAVLVTRAAARVLDEFHPDVVCTVNGKFLQWAPFVELAKARGLRYVTWEDIHVRPAGVAFAAGAVAHEYPHHAVWSRELARPFPEAERRDVREYFRLWEAGTVTPREYYDSSAVRDCAEARRLLRLPAGRRVVTLFPNLSCDSTSVGFDGAFTSMYDWLAKTVEYARRRPDMTFIVRAHPGEVRLPVEFRSTTPVCGYIRDRCGPVPENVRLVEPGDPVTSYALAELSDVVMLYTSTLGLELPLKGLRPWVAANAYYRGKGFTVDLESPGHMAALLDAGRFPERLTPGEVERAERLASLVRRRGVFSFPYLDETTDRFAIPDFGVLGPGGDALIDDLCRRVLAGDHFIDVGVRA